MGKLSEWNPGWENKELIKEFSRVYRERYESLIDSIEIREIIMIRGVRRAGKSTLMYQMIENLLKKGIDEREIASLKEFREKFKSRSGKPIVLTKNLEKSEGGIGFIPLWKWLMMVPEDR